MEKETVAVSRLDVHAKWDELEDGGFEVIKQELLFSACEGNYLADMMLLTYIKKDEVVEEKEEAPLQIVLPEGTSINPDALTYVSAGTLTDYNVCIMPDIDFSSIEDGWVLNKINSGFSVKSQATGQYKVFSHPTDLLEWLNGLK